MVHFYRFTFQWVSHQYLDVATDRAVCHIDRIAARGATLTEAAEKAIKQLCADHPKAKRQLVDAHAFEGEDEINLDADWDMLKQHFTNYIPDDRIDVVFC